MPAILSKPDNPHKLWIKNSLYGFAEQRITVSMLKIFAQATGLKTSGNKAELLQRCVQYQKQQKSAQLIQKRWRGYYTRLWIILKCGTRVKPVNDTDFYTLEPIENIPFMHYLHYTDSDTNLSYVFNITSLLKMFSNMPTFENPYTRATMNNYATTLIRICRFTHILYSKYNMPVEQNIHSTIELVRTLFIDIDLIGHYTNIGWYLDLTNKDLCDFYNNFHKLWTIALTDTIRLTIFPDGSGEHLFTHLKLDNTIEHNQRVFVEIGRLLTNTLGDRSLGVFYFLMTLTTVSDQAFEQYTYLYDTYMALVGFMD